MIPQTLANRTSLLQISLEAMSPRRVAVLFIFGIVLGTLSVWIVSALIVMPTMRGSGRCPYCQSARIREAWPRLRDRFLPWLKAFRCEACLERFYLLRRVEKRQRVRA